MEILKSIIKFFESSAIGVLGLFFIALSIATFTVGDFGIAIIVLIVGIILLYIPLSKLDIDEITITKLLKYFPTKRRKSENRYVQRKIQEIETIGIFLTIKIHIASGQTAISSKNQTKIFQLNNDKIFFNKKNPEFYYLLDRQFDGPVFQQLITNHSSSNSVTKSKGKDVKKGNMGKTAVGALIGNAIAPGIGGAVGAFVGSRGKKKQKSKSREVVNQRQAHQQTMVDVEVKSLATLTLLRLSDKKKIILTLKADTKDYNELLSLQTHPLRKKKEQNNKKKLTKKKHRPSREQAIEKLKEYKELQNLNIISDSEYAKKKNYYMKFL